MTVQIVRVPSCFAPGSRLQGSAPLIMEAGPAELVDVFTVDKEPHVISVAFGVQGLRRVPGIHQPSAEVIGLLDIGIAGMSFRAEVDLVQGQQFNVLASHLHVLAQYKQFPGANFGLYPSLIDPIVGVALGEEAVSHGSGPQRTICDETPMLANGSAYKDIPAFAKSLRVTVNPYQAVLGISVVNQTLWAISSQVVTAFPSEPIPLPSDAVQILIQNFGSTTVTNYRLVFELAL